MKVMNPMAGSGDSSFGTCFIVGMHSWRIKVLAAGDSLTREIRGCWVWIFGEQLGKNMANVTGFRPCSVSEEAG